MLSGIDGRPLGIEKCPGSPFHRTRRRSALCPIPLRCSTSNIAKSSGEAPLRSLCEIAVPICSVH